MDDDRGRHCRVCVADGGIGRGAGLSRASDHPDRPAGAGRRQRRDPDLTFPLLGDGFVPYSLGWLVGLPGLWSLAPLALAVMTALAVGLGGDDPRPRRWAAH